MVSSAIMPEEANKMISTKTRNIIIALVASFSLAGASLASAGVSAHPVKEASKAVTGGPLALGPIH